LKEKKKEKKKRAKALRGLQPEFLLSHLRNTNKDAHSIEKKSSSPLRKMLVSQRT